MNNNNKIRRKLLSPPGDTIQETIDTLGMNQYELAERLGKNIKNVNRIIKGKESITTDTAISLEKVLGISADFWLERERLYRKELAEIEFDEQLEKNKNWVNNFPVSEMEKLNWIPKSASMTEKAKALLTFFGIASPAQWNKIYESKKIAVAFRISLKNTSNPYSISAWLRQGELQAKRPGIKTYNKDIFKNSLSEIKKLSYEHPRDFLSKLQNICNQSGVALVFTPNISNATISGASRWIFDMQTPLIQLSGRYKTNDHFWFTFFHEAGHILLHGKKDVFLENVNGIIINKNKEDEADKFARNYLINEKLMSDFTSKKIITKETITAFSKEHKIHTAIIAGRLQHDKLISHSAFNELKIRINISDNIN